MSVRPEDSATVDVAVRAGRIFCSSSGWDGPGVVCVRDDRIVSVQRDFQKSANKEFDFPDGVLLPGLVDMHMHPALDGSVFGVDPDRWAHSRGVRTVLSQGDAGAANMGEYVERTILPCKTRIRMAINLSRIGESTNAGCFERIEDADVNECVAAVERYREHVWGLAVNVSHRACGKSDPREVLRRGLCVASETGLPLLFGMRRPQDWPLAEQLALLRAGDTVTYCFRREPHCIVEAGRVMPAVQDARQRGVWFDVGHGMASFAFEVAESAIADGFAPDTISTDLQQLHCGLEPTHDLPLVMSKLSAAGMSEQDVLTAVTRTPAAILGREDEIATLKPGTPAELVVLRRKDEPITLADCHGQHRPGRQWQTVFTLF